jgi:RNA polymerase sigma-70 factor (ECF subfamily)
MPDSVPSDRPLSTASTMASVSQASAEVAAAPDPALVAAVQARSQAALAEAYRRHGGAVWALAKRVCRDEHLAEDATQTVFVELWSRPDRFDGARGTLRSFLLTQSHARAVDLIRSEEARGRRQDREAVLAGRTVELVTSVYVEEMAESVRRAVDTLPAAERQPILLAHFGGRTYREAAELLGQPEGTVKSRIRAPHPAGRPRGAGVVA